MALQGTPGHRSHPAWLSWGAAQAAFRTWFPPVPCGLLGPHSRVLSPLADEGSRKDGDPIQMSPGPLFPRLPAARPLPLPLPTHHNIFLETEQVVSTLQ